jgi:signal transduction histidine kinase
MKTGAKERQRIGHELHDGLGQLLTGIAAQARK